jgi:hypothetical protein
MVARSLYAWLLVLAAGCQPAAGQDFVPQEHGLRYVGHEGRMPVTVEVTLREGTGGNYEYVLWVTPRSWASWFWRPTRLRSTLAYRDELLVPRGFDAGDGAERPPAGLPPGALDPFGVRLRARADIARGLRSAEYMVWRGGETYEPWRLQVTGTETVKTHDGSYEALKFRLGSETEWIDGWSAPLLVFHFVKLVSWRDGRKTSEVALEDKQF